MLTREELLFLKRAEGLEFLFGKIRQAKALIAEAQAEMAVFARTIGRAPHKYKSKAKSKAKKGKRPPKIEFGVDLPDELSANERKVYAELQKAGTDGRSPRDLAEALKLSASIVGEATRRLAKRKLVAATGATLNRIWKVGR